MSQLEQEKSTLSHRATASQRCIFRLCGIAAKLALAPIARVYIPDLTPFPAQAQGYIIAGNHRSLLDIFVALQAFHKWRIYPHIFVRSDYFRLPILGLVLRTLGALPARRGASAIDQAKQILNTGGILAIAPEGRIPRATERVEGLGPFKAGVGHLASSNGTPILLLAMLNTDTCWQLGHRFPRIHLIPKRRPCVRLSTAWLGVQPGQRGIIITRNVRDGLSCLLGELEQEDGTGHRS